MPLGGTLTKAFRLALVLLVGSSCRSARPVGYTQAAAIALVEQMAASEIDPSLPSVDLGTWLRETLKVSSVGWALDPGCGDPHNAKRNRVCVSALVPVASDLEVGIAFDVGDRAALAPRPKLEYVFEDQRDLTKYNDLRTLPALVEFMVRVSP